MRFPKPEHGRLSSLKQSLHERPATEASDNAPSAAPTVVPREVLYTWEAPQRQFKPIDRRRFLFVLACVVAFSVLLILLGQFWFMAAIASVMFLLYVLGTIPPITVQHMITNKGVETEGGVYAWNSLKNYWFSRRDDQLVLNVDTNMQFPARLIMLVNREQGKKVHELLRERLEYLDLRRQGRMSRFTCGEWVDPAHV
ncbi:MAG: hypothetical protein PHG63_02780 [Candidatus Dojkabacteria bacterium]|nr:hypothetical protein [Candidatus Dojkabacteria bacterium]